MPSPVDDDEFRRRYGRWALVTGAAQGIGRAFCEALARRGLDVLAVDRQAAKLDETCRACAAEGVEAEPFVADLADEGALARVEREADQREVGLLVCSAAHVAPGAFLDRPVEDHARGIAVNVLATTRLAHRFGTSMRRRSRGGIILLSSLASRQGTGWVATYAATKAFNGILAESLWWELRGDVDILAVLPGATDTEGLRANTPHVGDGSALARPEDVAHESLDALGRYPSWICGADNREMAEAMAGLTREQAIELVSDATRRMAGG